MNNAMQTHNDSALPLSRALGFDYHEKLFDSVSLSIVHGSYLFVVGGCFSVVVFYFFVFIFV